MPTINQLIRKSRKSAPKKPKAVALHRGFNSIKNKPTFYSSPFKRGVCTKVTTKITLIGLKRIIMILKM